VDEVKQLLEAHAPPAVIPQLSEPAPCQFNITANNDLEENNVQAVRLTMDNGGRGDA